jgi:FtsZ-interacting cell division protein YlmF
MGLFSRNKPQEEEKIEAAAERIIMKQMTDNEEAARDLVLEIKNGNPVCLNFKNLNEEVGNKYLAFFIGATVALDGRTTKINEYTYLFARREDFLDGSLKKWIDSIPG